MGCVGFSVRDGASKGFPGNAGFMNMTEAREFFFFFRKPAFLFIVQVLFPR